MPHAAHIPQCDHFWHMLCPRSAHHPFSAVLTHRLTGYGSLNRFKLAASWDHDRGSFVVNQTIATLAGRPKLTVMMEVIKCETPSPHTNYVEKKQVVRRPEGITSVFGN